MNIVIWSPNYAPELIGIPPLVTDAAEWLAEQGHAVSVVTAFPNYPNREIFPPFRGRLWQSETVRGVDIRRSWLRVRPGEAFADKALYELSLAAFSAPRAIQLLRRADVCVALVPTLLTAACAAAAVRFNSARYVVWVQDLVIQAARSVDGISGVKRRIVDGMRSLEALTMRSADEVVACSPGFVPYLRSLGAPASIRTIPNWVDTDRISVLPEPAVSERVRFLYTGNVGYTQGFETLTRAATLVGDGLEVSIVGGGNAVDQLRGQTSDLLSLRPTVPLAEYPALLASAHALVVIQRQIAANANLPSKIASYLASGRPVVASIGLDTPAADMLRASGGAIVVPPDDPIALAAAMRRLRDDAALRESLGARGRGYAVGHLSKRRVLQQLERAFVGR
jgi:colanic acid biosynthesis glycosyl transferase WcaI